MPSEFVHAIRYSPIFEDDYDRYLRGELPKDPGYLWALPTLVDKSMAPPQRHLMVVFGLTQPFQLWKGSWKSVKDSYADQLIETVSRTSCPDIARHIVFKKVLTPEFYENWTGKIGGPQGGFAMTYDQVGKRPPPHIGIDGLYCISESMGYTSVFLVSVLAVNALRNVRRTRYA